MVDMVEVAVRGVKGTGRWQGQGRRCRCGGQWCCDGRELVAGKAKVVSVAELVRSFNTQTRMSF